MSKLRKLLSLCMALVLTVSVFTGLGIAEAQAASYPKIPAFKISRIYQPDYDTNGLCYWSSMATVQGYCLGTYTYGGVTTNYRVAGKDYDYLKRSDAVTKLFKDGANGYANSYNNLTKFYPVKMTRVTDGIGKNAATYKKIYDQLAQGKPVVVYTGTHASVVIGYNGSSSTLEASGFTVMEIKKDGKWWSNSDSYYNKHANDPQIDSAKGSYMSCYVTLDSWISYCGNKLQEICYPTNAVKVASDFSFNANGGTGTMSKISVEENGSFTIPTCSFVNDGYTFKGYTVTRICDNKTYGTGGWQSWQATVDNQYEKKLYLPSETYTFGGEWLKDGGVIGGSYEFTAVWAPEVVEVTYYANYSGNNYMPTVAKSTFADNYQSRNANVYTVECETVNNTDVLKITGKAAGGSGKDLLFKSFTNKGINYDNNAGDNKTMTLSFKAKATVDDAKMYIRWGYTSGAIVVALSTEWQEYSVDMSKQINDGAHMHPFFSKAGTFYIGDITLVDESVTPSHEEENGEILFTENYVVGGKLRYLPTPEREGYDFVGWFTSKTGGEQVTEDSDVFSAHTALYARWSVADATEPETLPTDNFVESIPTETVTQPTEGTTVVLYEMVMMGDVDFSGKVNIKDATLIQKHLAKFVDFDRKTAFVANVVTSDRLNVKDATAIQKYCSKLPVDAEICVEEMFMY